MTQAPAKLIEGRLSDPTQNGLGLMRLVLAMLVLISHGFIAGCYGPDPLETFSGGTISFGPMAVHGFFVISGYLVSQSWDRLRSMPAYFTRRALRLFPGYWVCLLVTALVIAPLMWLLQQGSLTEYWVATPSPWSYVWNNFALMQRQWTVGSVAAGQPSEWTGYLNPSLWTLPHEFACYIALMFIASVGAIKKRSVWPILVFVAVFLNYALDPTHARWLSRIYAQPSVTRLPIYFAAGVVWWCWADRVQVSKLVWLAIATLAVVATGFGQYHWVMPFCMAAILFPLAAWLRTPRFLANNDYSYGIYLYATPLERVLAILKLPFASAWLFCLLATALVLPFAMLSWHLCERPSLELRSQRSRATKLTGSS